MNVYLLQRNSLVKHDENRAMVVVAEIPKQARGLANSQAGDEGKIWEDTSLVSCRKVTTGRARIVLIDYKAG